MSITVKDVAKKAGVATSTVSRVINDHPSISEATKKKVRKIMAEMHYVPNRTAQSLGKRTAGAVGIILPPLDSKEKMGNPFFLEIMEAINEEGMARGVTTAVAAAKDMSALLDNVKRMHQQKQVDGFVLLYAAQHDPVFNYLFEEDVPFTLVGQPYEHEEDVVYVDNDNQLLGKLATDFLIQNGHQTILFITNTIQENVYFERYFGYQKALMLAGLANQPVVPLITTENYVDFEDLLKESGATAAVVLDDVFALRVMQLAQMYGFQVPEDLSLISFNNSVFSTLQHPYLTSIDIDVSELGRVAVQRLLEQLQDTPVSGVRFVVPHHLIKRETVIKR
ncbi:LacI family DNA-binding transcriptional regulator [Enterococcus canis]|nr:LacI family DNA-binding transcriptional regulator [Enterococcus canis]